MRHSIVPWSLLALIAAGACGDAARTGGASSPSGVPAPVDGGANADAAATDGGDAPSGSAADAAAGPFASWRSQVIYLAVPDRFMNGDASNDASGNAGCFDPANPSKSHGGDLAGIRQRIPYLKDLGVTAVWVLPQYKDSPDRCGYHGYWADFVDPDDGAIEPTMGSAAELAGLVSDLHAAGMRFILDMVVNHAGRGARIVAQHPDWFHDPATCAALGDPGVYCSIGGLPLPDFAQEKPEVAAYLTGATSAWATRFGLDGIRMDTVKNVPVSYWQGWNPAIQAAAPGIFTVGEVFDLGPASNLLPYLNAGFASLFNYPLFGALQSTFAAGGSVDAIASKIQDEIQTLGYDRTLTLTSFVDNHDNPRFTSAVAAGASEADVVQRFHLALGAIFTLPGIPHLYYGDEVALYGGKDPDNRRDMPAWAWGGGTRDAAHPGEAAGNGQSTYAFVKKLAALRAAHPALQGGSYAEMWRQNTGPANVLAFYRGAGGDRIIVAINAGAGAATVTVPVQRNGAISSEDRAALADGTTLHDLLGEGAPPVITTADGSFAMTLPGRAMGVYR